MGGQLTVLGWHNVEPTWAFRGRAGAGARGLRRQLRVLKRTTNVVDLRWGLERLAAGDPLPPRAVALSFDDGYRDNLPLAVPALLRLDLPATFFLVPALLHGEISAWWEELGRCVATATSDHVELDGRRWRLGENARRIAVADEIAGVLKERSWSDRESAMRVLRRQLRPSTEAAPLFMGVDEARALVGHGFAVGSHTLRHAILAREHADEQGRDLAQARARLQQDLDVPADLLAYPNGRREDYDEDTFAAAEAAGHSWAITTRIGRNEFHTHRYEIRRLVLDPNQGVRVLARALRDLRSTHAC